MSKAKRNRAEREAVQHLRQQTQYTEGQFVGEIESGDEPAPARELIRQYTEARKKGVRACPHLHDDSTQSAVWLTPTVTKGER